MNRLSLSQFSISSKSWETVEGFMAMLAARSSLNCKNPPPARK